MNTEKNWVDDLRSFYDFVWTTGLDMCGHHVNQELMQDFANGGPKSQEMLKRLLEKYPTEQEARDAYSRDRNPS